MDYNFLQAPAATAAGGTEMMLSGLRDRIDPDLFNKFQIICSRVREVDESKIPILWLHDTWDDPENLHLKQKDSLARFKKFVFVSYHQALSYHLAFNIPYRDSVVFKNCIVPIEKHEKPTDKINLIYHTTPHRGLEILVPAFDHLSKMHDNLHLDVYSSFEIYGWGNRDEPYQKLFQFCKDHPNITYHGAQPNSVVRDALKKAHIFAYPSMWPETSCIAAIEAMSAGCAITCSDFGALPETTSNFAFMYRFSENANEHLNMFATALNAVIINLQTGTFKNHLLLQKQMADTVYDWSGRIPLWKRMLEDLVTKKE